MSKKMIARLLRRAASRLDPLPPPQSCTPSAYYNGSYGSVSTTSPTIMFWHGPGA